MLPSIRIKLSSSTNGTGEIPDSVGLKKGYEKYVKNTLSYSVMLISNIQK